MCALPFGSQPNETKEVGIMSGIPKKTYLGIKMSIATALALICTIAVHFGKSMGYIEF